MDTPGPITSDESSSHAKSPGSPIKDEPNSPRMDSPPGSEHDDPSSPPGEFFLRRFEFEFYLFFSFIRSINLSIIIIL